MNSETPAGALERVFFSLLQSNSPGIRLPGEGVLRLVEQATSGLSGALLMVHENPRECFPRLVVPITAAGLQGEQPLVDRTM